MPTGAPARPTPIATPPKPCPTPLLSQEPAAQLIRSTARQQWKLLAVEVLTAPEATSPVLSWWPAAASWLNALPPTALFISLLALALLLQAL